MVNHRSRDTRLSGNKQARRIGLVTDHSGNAAWPLLRSGRVNNCLHIAAASGNDDHDTFHRAHFTSAGLGSVCENGTDFAQREF